MSNRVDLAQLREMTAEQAASLPVDQIAMLLEDMADMKADTKRLDDLLSTALACRYSERATALRKAAGKDTGTVSIEDDGYVIRADLPAKVEWDQAELREAEEVIRSWGEDPTQYLTAVLSVPESRYKAWPDTIKAVFASARTVGTGRATYKMERAKLGRRAA